MNEGEETRAWRRNPATWKQHPDKWVRKSTNMDKKVSKKVAIKIKRTNRNIEPEHLSESN